LTNPVGKIPPFVTKNQNEYNTVIIGVSGKGKSSRIQELADQRAISYEEAGFFCQPSKEQLEARAQKMEEEKKITDVRLQKVRDAYWLATPEDDNEFWTINDSCNEFLGIDPTRDQVKAIFDCLPSQIIGGGVKFGFGDSEVRDELYAYVRDNANKLKTALNL
jgi:hypothetical protein